MAMKRTTKEERAAARAQMWADATTKMHRIVHCTANEALTLSNTNWCTQCGHKPIFHTMGAKASFCQVKDCKCEVWNMDAEESDAREQKWIDGLYAKAYSPWRWLLPIIVAGVCFAIGYYWPF